MLIQNQVLSTLSDIMSFMAPNAGGSIPSADSVEYDQWRRAIQVKYEEAARRGWWRRLLVKDTLTVFANEESVVLPIQFQRANALYIFALNGEDLADPDRLVDSSSQTIFLQQITDPEDGDFGLWQANFKFPIVSGTDITLWYFATPPIPVEPTDKILLAGDMVAFGALQEIFRATNLEGSQDSAQLEYENRLNNYLAVEVIPPRNELITFDTNPQHVNRTRRARNQYLTRPDRVGRNY